jgi:hypothetical protein
MSLFDSLVPFRGARKVRSLADSLADQLTERVWEEAGVKARYLSLAESRGYFRAHSNRIVRAELRKMASGTNAKLGPWQLHEVEVLAAETIVIRALQQLMRFRKQTSQTRHLKAA